MEDISKKILQPYIAPINELLNDPDVTDIFINRFDCIFYEKKFKKTKYNQGWPTEEQYKTFVEQLTRKLSFDKSTTRLNLRMDSGHRVFIAHAAILANGSPAVSIRRIGASLFTLEEYKAFGTLTDEIHSLFQEIMKKNSNILLSGQTGSGKTSMLNYLFSLTDPDLRIITFENIQEIILKHEDRINIEVKEITKPISSNAMNTQDNTLAAVIDDVATRKRPDRVILGEIQNDDSAFAYMKSLNMGLKGTASTTHANNPQAAVERVTVLASGEQSNFTLDRLEMMLLQKLDYIIQMDRIEGHGIKILDISKVNKDKIKEGNALEQLVAYDLNDRKYIHYQDCY